MAEKRRDSRGRILRNGEYQGKNGRYEYKYTDCKGERRSVYSWKLVDTDKVPDGKKCTESLRAMEKRLQRDLEDGIDSHAANKMKLNDLFDGYIASKYELKQSTRTNYLYMYNKFVRETIGVRSVSSIKYSTVKKFYVDLLEKKGFQPNTLEIIHTILHPIFTIAVRDGIIRTNPSDGVVAEIKKSRAWEKKKRHALTEAEQAAFIDYVASTDTYKHWRTIFTVLLGTGCRVGEVVGLRWEDCNFTERTISINHNLIYRQQDSGKCEYHITTPKTEAGVRMVPMLSAVEEALRNEYKRQLLAGFNETVVDGYSGFIFSNRYGSVMNPHSINETTMNVYNEATREKKLESFANLEGKIKVS